MELVKKLKFLFKNRSFHVTNLRIVNYLNNNFLNLINKDRFFKYYLKNCNGFIVSPAGHKVKQSDDVVGGIDRIIETPDGKYFIQRFDKKRHQWITFPNHMDYVDEALENTDVSDHGYPEY